jgi:hypothetical protein
VATFAEGPAMEWEPFGVTEADFAAAPEQDGVRVVNVTPDGGREPGRAGWWLRGAAAALGVLAAAAAAVSWDAQYTMVRAVKHHQVVSALEAGIPDVGAVIFAALGVALALHGKRAVRPRALNAVCIGISLAMNALAAGHGWRDLAIWVMPAGVYALASDTLIGVVRAWVLARARNAGETLADDGPTPLAMVGGLALWLLRLVLDRRGTLRGFRTWVITDCPVAPGLRPGHVAQLDAIRQAADEQITVAIGQRDEAVEHAAAQAEQARGEAERARAAETEIRAELDQVRADARQAVTQAMASAAREREELRAELAQARQDADRLTGQVRDSAAAQVVALEQANAQLRGERDRLAEAARERDEVRAWAERQIDGLRAQLQQARDDATRLVEQTREDAAARIAGLETDHAGLREERDRLAAELRATARQQRYDTASTARGQQTRRARRDGPTKRDQMIELAGQHRDLTTVPMTEVSKLANTVAAEIGYSPGTARRELIRHVRELQGAPAENTPENEGGQAR